MFIFVEGIALNVPGNMWMYWAARPNMQLCQLDRYSDTLIQVGGSTPSSLTKIQPQLSQRGYARNQPQRPTRGRGCESCRENYTAVAPVEATSKSEHKTHVIGNHGTIHGASSPVTPKLGYCHVCLVCDHTMERYALTVSADELVDIRKENWNRRLFLI